MNTAMDDGRQEAPGEQTLSFQAVRDEDVADAPDDDGFDAFGTKGARKAAGGGRAAKQPPASSDTEAPEGVAATAEEPRASAEPAEPTDSQATDSQATDFEVTDFEVPESDAADSETMDSKATDFEPADSDVTDAEATGSEATDSDAADSEPASSDAADSVVTVLEATDSDAADSEPAASEWTGPELAASEPTDLEPAVAPDPPASADTADQPTHEPIADDAVSEEPTALAGDAASEEPTALADDAVSEEPVAGGGSAGSGDLAEVPEFEPPSLFMKPAALGGPGARKAPAAAHYVPPTGDVLDEPGARDEAEEPSTEEQPAEEPSTDDQPQATAAADDQPQATGTADDQPQTAAADDEKGQAAAADDEQAQAEPQPGKQRREELPPEAVEALMAALDTLRETVAELRFGLDLPGVKEARQARAELLAQLEDYVLPRVRTSTAPALIVIAGSTGAGKSTLVNTLAEKNVSRTGVRRPTTGVPVLVCHPEDRQWFAEGELLGGLQRLDQLSPEAGMGSVVVVATEKLPQGVALLDTPDIDSVVEEHHEIAHRMLDAADLWIFVTTAARYADAPAWNLLKLAKERGARLAIVLSRMQPRSSDVVLKHFVRMLTEYGLGEIDRFVINESKVTDGKLPDSEVTDLRLWLAELSVDEARRDQAVRETLNGVLNSFRTRVPALARHLEGEVAFRTELRSDVEAAFRSALSEIDKASKNGSLLHGEVLARWQDFAGSGDLMRSLQLRKRGRAAKQAPERVLAFKAAIRAGLESVIVAAANRASEEVAARWRHRSELGAKLSEGLDRPSDNLVRHTGRAIASWQEHLSELVRTDGVAKRSVSKLVSFDPDALALIFTVAMFSGSNGEGVPHRLVNALLGAESLRGIGAKALSDLRARIGMLFDEESMRYVQALDSAGIPDESAATRLYQATYNLEVVR
ncbi:dynamin family protein [Nonomuraea sp. NPDC050786]|uniref:dynamin family protein n=1 Tax=Nonomuraea sp. NPDC050786 TaxID=3154840 RepID=UPI0033E9D0F7